jgi:hypothetical protein
MAKTKIEKIAGIEEQIVQLENQRKRLIQEQKAQERKERTTRLCKRAGLLESLLPETITLTDEQFKAFLEKAVTNDYGRNMLARIAAQGGNTATTKPAATAQSNGTSTAQNEGGAGETAV